MSSSLVVLGTVALVTAAWAEPLVTLPYGTVAGNGLEKVNEFLGIPYAAKASRFMPPMPWTQRFDGGHLDATAYTPICPQIPDATTRVTTPISEDCLHLNIYTPSLSIANSTVLPVMVWIHGGALNTGSAMMQVYNGTQLSAKEDVVVVAMNYRLNVFGFSVTSAGGDSTVANNGFRDQREALRWVRNHISAFGGDPSNIMIFGESAGGQSVATHVLSVGSGDFFDAAIAESGDILNVRNLSEGIAQTQDLAATLGCHNASAGDQLACMQAARVDEILRLTHGSGPGAVVDNDVLPAHPLTLIENGNFNKVPFALGNNKDEGNLFIYPPVAVGPVASRPATAGDIRCAVKKTFGTDTGGKILQLYPAVDENGVDNRNIAAQLFGAVTFHCDNRRVAQALSRAGAAPWVYSFNRKNPCFPFQGAAHGSEIPYVFNHVEAAWMDNSSCAPLPEDYALARTVSGLWASFARTHKMANQWPRFESPSYEATLKIDLSLVDTFDLDFGVHRSECEVLKRIGVYDDRAYPPLLPAAMIIGLRGSRQPTPKSQNIPLIMPWSVQRSLPRKVKQQANVILVHSTCWIVMTSHLHLATSLKIYLSFSCYLHSGFSSYWQRTALRSQSFAYICAPNRRHYCSAPV